MVVRVELEDITEEYKYGWRKLNLIFCKGKQKLSNKCFLSQKTLFFFASPQKVYDFHTQNCMILTLCIFGLFFVIHLLYIVQIINANVKKLKHSLCRKKKKQYICNVFYP